MIIKQRSNRGFVKKREKTVSVLVASMFLIVWGCGESEKEIVLPEVVETSPANGETLTYPDSLKVVFNKPMDADTIKVTMGSVSGNVTFDKSMTEFAWLPEKWGFLSPGGLQPVMIEGRDEGGNPLVGYQPITVNIVLPDYEPIEITRTVPDSNQPVDAEVQSMLVQFSEWVDPSESTIWGMTEAGKSIPIDVQWEGMNVEVRFKEPLEPQTTYTIRFLNLLDAGSFRTEKAEFTFTTYPDSESIRY